jgi:hypothetical protein
MVDANSEQMEYWPAVEVDDGNQTVLIDSTFHMHFLKADYVNAQKPFVLTSY